MEEQDGKLVAAGQPALRLLVVDDDSADRQIVARALSRSGLEFELVEAATGRCGLDLLKNSRFDCALIDLNLPDGNSLDCFSEIMARPSLEKPSIVMITGGGDDQLAAEAIQRGAQEYLTKSDLDPASIRRVVERALEKASLNRELELRESELMQMSFYDRLTRLPNRNLYFDRLNQQLTLSGRNGEEFAVLNIDLDRFKQVNDDHGHQAGDNLLVQAAERLTQSLRESDTVARFGGDEFTGLLPNTGREGALQTAKNIVAAFNQPFLVDNSVLSIGASVGIAVYPRHGRDSDTLLSNSDRAMYEAKQRGSGFALCAPRAMPVRALRRNIARDLAQALNKADQLFLEYQPQVDLETGTVAGVEALVRWRHPDRGLLPPSQFMPVAERSTSSIESLTWYVIRASLNQLRQWQDHELNLNLSINLSPMVIERPALVPLLYEQIRESGVDPRRLCMEVTETALMQNVTSARATLHQIKDLGCDVSIDDFGTGYSSLKNLRDFPIDEIKIDQTFVAGMEVEPGDRIIVESVLALGRAFDVRVVAEGIESQSVRESLIALGCSLGQGFHFARPMSAQNLAAWVRRLPVIPLDSRQRLRPVEGLAPDSTLTGRPQRARHRPASTLRR